MDAGIGRIHFRDSNGSSSEPVAGREPPDQHNDLCVALMRNVTFVVDGLTLTPEKVAAHLQETFEKNQTTIETADQFVSQYATKSKFTNNPYQVRLADGAIVPSSVFFRQVLASIENRN